MTVTSEQVQAYTRIVIYWLAGFAVNYGVLSADTKTAVVGAAVTMANLVWTIYGNRFLAKINEIAKYDTVKTIVVTTAEIAKATPSAKITQ